MQWAHTMFEAIIFDFDGIILDSEPLHYAACQQVLKDLHITLSYDEFSEKYIGLADKEMFPQILVNNGYHFSSDQINSLIGKKVAYYLANIENHTDLPMITGLDQYVIKISQEIKKIAICSGSSRQEITTTLNKLKNGSLKDYFSIIVSSEDVKNGKPSPEGYLLTAQHLKVSPAKCLVFEDSPAGIEAAKTAGMYVIAFPTTQSRSLLHKANKIAANFMDLL